ncbi:MAG: ATP-dependent dethiobiotin synthetase BioD [Bacteroidia bacterium]|nr:ATP-dependent dethiobiotin synthetase BioD [Bacteroidia bacterium]
MSGKTIFISAIDTDAGKTIVTGLLALSLKNRGLNVITQKIAQTGCNNISDDILKHREIMGEELNEFDNIRLTCPYIFNFPASPHLSAKLENTEINTEEISSATNELEKHFDYILLEGVGGLMVPLNTNELLIDYISNKQYPLILVTSGKLGTINHTLLSLEAIRRRNIELKAIVYNNYINTDKIINSDTKEFFKNYLKKDFPDSQLIEIEKISKWTDCNAFNSFNI